MTDAAGGYQILPVDSPAADAGSPFVLKGTVEQVEGNLARVSVGGRVITVELEGSVQAGQTVLIDLRPTPRADQGELRQTSSPKLSSIVGNVLAELGAPNDAPHVRFVLDALSSPDTRPFDLLTVAYPVARGLGPSQSLLWGSTAILLDEIVFEAQPLPPAPVGETQGSLANLLSSAIDALQNSRSEGAPVEAALHAIAELPSANALPDFRPEGIFRRQSQAVAEALQIIETETTALLESDPVLSALDAAIRVLEGREAILGENFSQAFSAALGGDESEAAAAVRTLTQLATSDQRVLSEITGSFETAVRNAADSLLAADTELAASTFSLSAKADAAVSDALAALARELSGIFQARTEGQPPPSATDAAAPPAQGVAQGHGVGQAPAQAAAQQSPAGAPPLLSPELQARFLAELFAQDTSTQQNPPDAGARPAVAAPAATQAAQPAPQGPANPAVMVAQFIAMASEMGATEAAQSLLADMPTADIASLREFLAAVFQRSALPAAELESASAELVAQSAAARNTLASTLTAWSAFATGGEQGEAASPSAARTAALHTLMAAFAAEEALPPELDAAQRNLEETVARFVQRLPEGAETLRGPRTDTAEFLRVVREFLRSPRGPERLLEAARRVPPESLRSAREGALRIESTVLRSRPEINSLARAHSALTAAQDKILTYRAASASHHAEGKAVFIGEFALVDDDGLIPVRFRFAGQRKERRMRRRPSEALIDVGLSRLGRVRTMIALEERNVSVDMRLNSERARSHVNAHLNELRSSLKKMGLVARISVGARRSDEEELVVGLRAPLRAHLIDLTV